MEVFADNINTTKTLPSALEESLPYMDEKFGLESQSGGLSREAGEAVAKARKTVARSLGVKTGDIFFVPSAESFFYAMLPVFLSRDGVISQPEWLNLRNSTKTVDSAGLFEFVDSVPVDEDINSVICVYGGGTDFDRGVEKLAEDGVPVVADVSLAVSRMPLFLRKHKWDYALIDGNLAYGPDGVNIVYASENSFLRKCGLLNSAMPSGRVSVASIVGCSHALEFIRGRMEMENDKLKKFEVILNNDFSDGIEDAEIVTDNQIPGVVSLKVSDIDAVDLDKYMEDKLGIYVDTRQKEKDAVLTVVLGIYTEMEDVEMLGDMIPTAITNVRRGVTE